MIEFKEGEAIRKRYLAWYADLKKKNPELSNEQFAERLGYKGANLISDLKKKVNPRYIDVALLYNTKKAFPSLDINYILFGKDVPEDTTIPNATPGPKKKRPAKRTVPKKDGNQLLPILINGIA